MKIHLYNIHSSSMNFQLNFVLLLFHIVFHFSQNISANHFLFTYDMHCTTVFVPFVNISEILLSTEIDELKLI